MKTVAIVDYGMCNLDSVARAIQECGGSPVIVREPKDLTRADRIILPGVGAFPDAMNNLQELGMDEALHAQVVDQGIPFLGLCLGMQLLATSGTEGRNVPGLGWIKGEVRLLKPELPTERVPHMGWNEVHIEGPSQLFREIPAAKDFYFVHSYHLACEDPDDVAAVTPYCGGFVSAVSRDNIYGLQFHPEKSQKAGFQLLSNFLVI